MNNRADNIRNAVLTCFGLGGMSATIVLPTLTTINEVAQTVGVVAGAVTAVISAVLLVRKLILTLMRDGRALAKLESQMKDEPSRT